MKTVLRSLREALSLSFHGRGSAQRLLCLVLVCGVLLGVGLSVPRETVPLKTHGAPAVESPVPAGQVLPIRDGLEGLEPTGDGTLYSRDGFSLLFLPPSLRCGGVAVRRAPKAAAKVGDDRIDYDYGTWAETFASGDGGRTFQHLFVIRDRLPGEAELRIPVRTDLVGKTVTGNLLHFDGPDGRGIYYRDALAADAAGSRTPLEMRYSGGEIVMRLPGEWLAGAKYPVLIDPLVGVAVDVSATASSAIWRHYNSDIAWNPIDKIYFLVWTANVSFDWHGFLYGADVQGRSLSIGASGDIVLGSIVTIAQEAGATNLLTVPPTIGPDPVSGPEAQTMLTNGPSDTNNSPVVTNDTPVEWGPRVAWSRIGAGGVANQFLVVYSRGIWRHRHSYDSHANQPVAHAIHPRSKDVEPTDSAIRAIRVGGTGVSFVLPVTTVATGVGIQTKPDVSWDGVRYLVAWESHESPLSWLDEGGTQHVNHIFYTRYKTRWATIDPLGGAVANAPSDLTSLKWRFFVKGPTDVSTNILEATGGVEALDGVDTNDVVPLDADPRIDSLILPGADGQIGTGDDVIHGSLMTWTLTSLVFNVPKSRIRGFFFPADGPADSGPPDGPVDTTPAVNDTAPLFVWDVFNPDVNLAGRAAVAAGPSSTIDTSHFMVAMQLITDTVSEGASRVEMVGDIVARLVVAGEDANADGDFYDIDDEFPGLSGGPLLSIDVGSSTKRHLWPSVAFSKELDQYMIAWTMTDTTLWNPTTRFRFYFPKGATFTSTEEIGAPLATAYSSIAAATAPYIVQPPPDSDPPGYHHFMMSMYEDDSGKIYTQRTKAPPAPFVGDPSFALSSATLSFSASVGGAPQSSNIQLSNDGSVNSVLTWSALSNQSWCTVSPEDGSTPQGTPATVTITVDPGGFADGVYQAEVAFSSATANDSPQTVTITMTVGTPPPPLTPGLTAAPVAITVNGVISGPNPSVQTSSVTFAGGGAQPPKADWLLDRTAITPLGSEWVKVGNPAGSSMIVSEQLQFTVINADFSFDMSDALLVTAGAGTYTATFTLSSPGPGTNTATVNTTTITITLNLSPAGGGGGDGDGGGDGGGGGGDGGGGGCASSVVSSMASFLPFLALALVILGLGAFPVRRVADREKRTK